MLHIVVRLSISQLRPLYLQLMLQSHLSLNLFLILTLACCWCWWASASVRQVASRRWPGGAVVYASDAARRRRGSDAVRAANYPRNPARNGSVRRWSGVACLHSDRLTAGHNLHTPFPLLHHLLLSLSDSSPRATVPTTETLTIKRFRAQRQLQCHCHIK